MTYVSGLDTTPSIYPTRLTAQVKRKLLLYFVRSRYGMVPHTAHQLHIIIAPKGKLNLRRYSILLLEVNLIQNGIINRGKLAASNEKCWGENMQLKYLGASRSCLFVFVLLLFHRAPVIRNISTTKQTKTRHTNI